jgi:hypothetical protein
VDEEFQEDELFQEAIGVEEEQLVADPFRWKARRGRGRVL